MGNNMLTLQEDNMDQFFQWDAEGTLGTTSTRRYSLSLRTSICSRSPRSWTWRRIISKMARLNKKVS